MSWTSILTTLQMSAVNLLEADEFFNGLTSTNQKPIPIITETKGDIETQILQCLGSVGICTLILTPIFEFHQNLAQDLSGWALITVTIYEDAVVNQTTQGTQITAIALAERVVAVMHWALHNVPTATIAADPTAANRFLGIPRPIQFMSDGPPLQYNVGFQAHITLNPLYNP